MKKVQYSTNQILHIIKHNVCHGNECGTSLKLLMMCNIAHMHEWQTFYRLKSAVCLARTARNLAGNQSCVADKRFYSNGLGDTGSIVLHVWPYLYKIVTDYIHKFSSSIVVVQYDRQ